MTSNGSGTGSSKSAGAQLATIDLPSLGAQGDACAECGAPLATDQRYCLNCGTRRAGPRLDFTSHLTGTGPTAHVSASPAPPAGPARSTARDWGGWPGAFGIGLLGVMLLIGVLIGKNGNDSGTQQAAAPVVVQGQTTTPTTGTSTTASNQDKSGGADKKGKDAGGGGSEPVDVGNAHVASADEINALQNCTGAECQQIQDSLGDNVATPGEAPPTDHKAPGGGSGGNATVIK